MTDETSLDITNVLTEQQHRWRNGDRFPIETFIERHTQLLQKPEAILDLIYNEVLLREDLGERPAATEYQSRFPDFHEQIARQFRVHNAISFTPLLDETEQAHGPKTSAANFPDATPADLGLQIPGFKLLEVVGRGGSGVAYRARDVALNRIVAVKLLFKGAAVLDDSSRAKLLREAESSAALRHPVIVNVHQVGEIESSPFLVMEYLEGGSLADRLRDGTLPVDEAVRLTRRIAEGVQHAHDNGIVHRDLKPGNVLLNSAAEAFVCDFGLAKQVDAPETLHATGDVIGTPAYMPPEQARGETGDERSDIYSLGAVLYESVGGRAPFIASTPWEILNQVMSEDAPPLRQLNPTLPKDLETICQKCLEKNPNRRYPSAKALIEELDRYLNGRPIEARPVSTIPTFHQMVSQKPSDRRHERAADVVVGRRHRRQHNKMV